jgi:hypothetical protein
MVARDGAQLSRVLEVKGAEGASWLVWGVLTMVKMGKKGKVEAGCRHGRGGKD